MRVKGFEITRLIATPVTYSMVMLTISPFLFVAVKSRKRKRTHDNADVDAHDSDAAATPNHTRRRATPKPKLGGSARDRRRASVNAEAEAFQRLQESLPPFRLLRVTEELRRRTGGSDPTKMAVVLTAARETIVDLARQQVAQTERSFQTIQAELLRLLTEANERLARFEGVGAGAGGGGGDTIEDESSDESSNESSDESSDEDEV